MTALLALVWSFTTLKRELKSSKHGSVYSKIEAHNHAKGFDVSLQQLCGHLQQVKQQLQSHVIDSLGHYIITNSNGTKPEKSRLRKGKHLIPVLFVIQ